MSGATDFNEFYAGNYARLVRQVRPLCAAMEDAEDCVQDACAKAFLRWSHIRRYEDPLSWVRLVATNTALSRLRRLKVADRAIPELTLMSGLQHDPTISVVDRMAMPQALKRLPRSQQLAIVLFHLNDQSVAWIATTTGESEGNVRAQLSRGRKRLAVDLREH